MQPNPAQASAVQQALQRRGMGAAGDQGALTQVSPDAAMQAPAPQPANPSEMNKSSAPQVAPPQKWEPQNQQDFVVSALVEQLKNTHKLEVEKLKTGQTQPSMGAMPVAQAEQAVMPQGGGNPFMSSPGGKTDYFSMAPSMANSSKQGGYPF